MYLSVIEPAARAGFAVRHVGDPQAEHRWLWRWFPAPTGSRRSFLFRRHESSSVVLDRSPNHGLPVYYAVSDRQPLPELDGWAARCRPYTPMLTAGDMLVFELRANPVVQRSPSRLADSSARARSTRHDVVMDAKTRWARSNGWASWSVSDPSRRPPSSGLIHDAGSAWLARQGERHGFALADSRPLTCEPYLQYGGGERRFSTLDYSGMLRVLEPETFNAALREGIGPAKAFGCGLMLVRRV